VDAATGEICNDPAGDQRGSQASATRATLWGTLF